MQEEGNIVTDSNLPDDDQVHYIDALNSYQDALYSGDAEKINKALEVLRRERKSAERMIGNKRNLVVAQQGTDRVVKRLGESGVRVSSNRPEKIAELKDLAALLRAPENTRKEKDKGRELDDLAADPGYGPEANLKIARKIKEARDLINSSPVMQAAIKSGEMVNFAAGDRARSKLDDLKKELNKIKDADANGESKVDPNLRYDYRQALKKAEEAIDDGKEKVEGNEVGGKDLAGVVNKASKMVNAAKDMQQGDSSKTLAAMKQLDELDETLNKANGRFPWITGLPESKAIKIRIDDAREDILENGLDPKTAARRIAQIDQDLTKAAIDHTDDSSEKQRIGREWADRVQARGNPFDRESDKSFVSSIVCSKGGMYIANENKSGEDRRSGSVSDWVSCPVVSSLAQFRQVTGLDDIEGGCSRSDLRRGERTTRRTACDARAGLLNFPRETSAPTIKCVPDEGDTTKACLNNAQKLEGPFLAKVVAFLKTGSNLDAFKKGWRETTVGCRNIQPRVFRVARSDDSEEPQQMTREQCGILLDRYETLASVLRVTGDEPDVTSNLREYARSNYRRSYYRLRSADASRTGQRP
ncbi:MAG: hypothetical protein C5B49_08435 [Bdellovibrio sp.]|nr:MAG: hypothetical protein C5B49_08435 [Bdellovibrio sp.]